jgi:predicted nucleic acid-binding protein
MARILLDSTFLHDLVRDESAAVDKLDELIEERTPVAISAISVFEVGVGLRGDAEKYLETFHETLDEISIRPFGPLGAWEAVQIQHELLDRGKRIGAVDVLIAGKARSHGMTVLTRNVDEFERVDGLAVETY